MDLWPDRPSRRSLLAAALAAGAFPALLRHVLAAEVPRFDLGVASGTPRPDSVVLWTRLTGDDLPDEVPVRWELAHDERFTRLASRGSFIAQASSAHSVHAEAAGLEPARSYWYRFTALGQQSAAGRTRTAPAPDAAVDSLRFAIASCQRWDHGHWAAWRHLATEPLDLVLFLGDYIYEYPLLPSAVRLHRGGWARTLDGYRDRHAQYKSDPALQAAHAACPWLVVWDDHEVENDYAGLQGERLQDGFEAQRAAAYQAWWEHMPMPMSARPRGPDLRIVGRLDWGRLARLHLIDHRQYRDPQACPRPGRGGSNTVRLKDCPALDDPRRSLLGWEQERWLAEGWSLDRPWNLLAQQTLMARFETQDRQGDSLRWTDGWDGYAASRQRLLQTVADRRVPGPVVLSGDVHAHYVADLKADFDDARGEVVATEFCGTSISSRGGAQSRVDAALALNPHLHYGRSDQRGAVSFTLAPQQLQARLLTVDDPTDAASTVRVAAGFRVDARRPGAQRA